LRFVLHLLVMLTVALGVGFGLSWFALTDGRLFGAFDVGPWAAWPAAGSANPDPYTRAYLSRNGALELGQSEGLQFTAVNDSAGQPLSRACRYRIEGKTPVATFWTLVATDAAGVNIARPDGVPDIHSARLARANDGSAIIYVGRTLAPRNWLEITGDGPFSLVLTLYDVSVFAGSGGTFEGLPAIIKEACS
jgi:hypothetical protein